MGFLPKSRKARRRVLIILAVAPILALAAGLSLYAMRDAVVFFYGPTQAKAEHVPAGRVVRIGGLVQPGSLVKDGQGEVTFAITDNAAVIRTVYRGDLPDLFREGQGVVAQGAFDGTGAFHAQTVLAKHDERYMPREVVKALKDSGEWRPDEGAQAGPGRGPGR